MHLISRMFTAHKSAWYNVRRQSESCSEDNHTSQPKPERRFLFKFSSRMDHGSQGRVDWHLDRLYIIEKQLPRSRCEQPDTVLLLQLLWLSYTLKGDTMKPGRETVTCQSSSESSPQHSRVHGDFKYIRNRKVIAVNLWCFAGQNLINRIDKSSSHWC